MSSPSSNMFGLNKIPKLYFKNIVYNKGTIETKFLWSLGTVSRKTAVTVNKFCQQDQAR